MTFSSGTYFPFPVAAFTSTEAVLSGVGILRTISVALNFELKFVRTLTVYSTLDLPCSTMIGWTRSGRLTLVVDRYLLKAIIRIKVSTGCNRRIARRHHKGCSSDAPHELKLAIGRNEADGSVYIELSQSHALMELAIVQFNSIITSTSTLAAEAIS